MTTSRTLSDVLLEDHDAIIDERGIVLQDSVWDDMVSNLFGKQLLSTAGKLDYDYDENSILFSSGGDISVANDRIGGNQEIEHKFKTGSVTFHPHIHWFQDAATKYELTMRYRVQHNGSAKETSWTTITLTANDTTDAYVYSTGVLNQLTEFPEINVSVGLSDTIQFQIARTDSLGGTMSVYFLDLHGEIDTMGSQSEYTK